VPFRSSISPFLNGFALLALLLATAGCSAKRPPDPQYQAAGNLLEIVKDFQRLVREDQYRFPIPKDVTGVNIAKATLVRLDDYEKGHPGGLSEIVDFSKAMAYERLRDYNQAMVYYHKVAESNGRLGEQAKKNIEAVQAFQDILQKPLPSRDPFEYVRAMDEKVQALTELSRTHQGTPYEFLALVEEERLDRAKVAFAELNRSRLQNGNQLVIVGYTQLITKHKESKNLNSHLLDFGDYYVKLAKEYTAQNDPEGLNFDMEVFNELAKSALKYYTEVAQQDGVTEKMEAEGKIKSLQALTEKIGSLQR